MDDGAGKFRAQRAVPSLINFGCNIDRLTRGLHFEPPSASGTEFSIVSSLKKSPKFGKKRARMDRSDGGLFPAAGELRRFLAEGQHPAKLDRVCLDGEVV